MRQLENNSSIALDFIRGVSAQMVVFGHGILFSGALLQLRKPDFPYLQNIAVITFFVLSGFLISYSLFRKLPHGYTLYQYFVDRFSRIYVTFIPALLFVLAIDWLSIYLDKANYAYHGAFNAKVFFGNLFMLQDFPKLGITSFGSARTFWTLAVEWWIYIFFGLTIFCLRETKRIGLTTFALLAVLSIVPLHHFLGGRGNGLTIYWLFGAVVMILWSKEIFKDLSLYRKICLLVIFVGLSTVRLISTKTEYDVIFCFSLAVSIFLILEVSDQIKFNRAFKTFSAYIASYSYTLYLIHYSIFDFCRGHLGDQLTPMQLFFLGFIASNLIAISLGRMFELKATNLVKKRMYSWEGGLKALNYRTK